MYGPSAPVGGGQRNQYGATSMLYLLPEENLSIAILTNKGCSRSRSDSVDQSHPRVAVSETPRTGKLTGIERPFFALRAIIVLYVAFRRLPFWP